MWKKLCWTYAGMDWVMCLVYMAAIYDVPNEWWMFPREISSQIWTRNHWAPGQSEVQPAVLDGPKHNVPDICSIGFKSRQAWGPVSGINSFIQKVIMNDRQHNILHGFSKPFHVCDTCSGWTCSYLWKAQDTSGGSAYSGILGQMPIGPNGTGQSA